MMFQVRPDVIAVTIPIVFLLGAIAVTITALILESGRKEQKHKERLAAMEKGIPIPEEPVKQSPPRYLAMRAWGLVFTLFGVALVVGISAEKGINHGLWGLLPLSIGVALLISAYMERKDLS
jgi:NADH:ubiquinone oxidoreductase subunit 3 (subunit A)